MTVKNVSVHNVRSYGLESIPFHTNTSVIIGKNGSGKTTLIEAIYMLLRGTSFRGRDREVIAHSSRQAEIKLEFTDQTIRRLKLRVGMNDKVEKEFVVDGKTSARLPQKMRKPVVLFEPDELRMLSSSPQRRRDFLDGIISRLWPAYGVLLNRYNRVLLQRNELLKKFEDMDKQSWESHLFVWDVKFAELAELIVRERLKFIVRSNQRLSVIYSSLADAKHAVRVEYSSQIPTESYKQSLVTTLNKQRVGDAYRGYTSAGPQRDDITMFLDNFAAGETASRGEMRTIMLAFKLLEVELQEEQTSEAPLILMDDVLSELDINREQQLLRALTAYQTIITATDLRDELKVKAQIITLS